MLIVFFLFIYYAYLGFSFLTGNFDFNPNSDHKRYMVLILDGKYPRPEIGNVPPLYSFYMAFKWKVTEAVKVPYWTGKFFIDVFMVVFAGVLSTVLGRMLTRNRIIAVCAGGGLIAAPLFTVSAAEELAVIFFQPVFLLIIILLVRELQRPQGPKAAWIFLTGALNGAATLIRGETQFLVLPVFLLLIWRLKTINSGIMKALFLAAVFLIAQNIALSPWTKLQRESGDRGEGTVFPAVYSAYFKGITRHPGNAVADSLIADYRKPERSMSGVLDFNLKWLKEDPLALTQLYLLKYCRTWYMSDSRRWDKLTLIAHGPFWFFSFLGIFFWMRKSSSDMALYLIIGFIFYICSISAAMDGLARYTSSLYGFLGILSGVAITTALFFLRRKESNQN